MLLFNTLFITSAMILVSVVSSNVNVSSLTSAVAEFNLVVPKVMDLPTVIEGKIKDYGDDLRLEVILYGEKYAREIDFIYEKALNTSTT